MIPVLTPAEMAAADARTIAGGTPGAVLMERAGRAVAWRVRRVLGGTYGRRVVVVCGKGNNGGDGRITATALAAWGARADVFAATDPVDARARRALARADAVVDAMFGTGFRGALEGAPAAWVDAIGAREPCVVAVDIPSGIDGLTGAAAGPAIRAAHTVTFAAPKPGLWLHPGRTHAGTVTVADIGIELGPDASRTTVVEPDDLRTWLRPRAATTHKWRAGVLVIGGSDGMAGAPMLAAHAAMRAGAGIVWAALPGDAATRSVGSEVITTRAGDAAVLTPDAVPDLLDRARRFRAVVLGPGLGRDRATVEAVGRVVAGVEVPIVLDADALVALGEDRAVVAARRAPTVLTPHDGEFAALTGAPPDTDRIAAARDLAATTGATVLLKGPTTVVADPDGRARLNPTGTPRLATAGSGDVLSGVIAALCAQGLDPADAAAASAFVHGRAARQGHTGLIATDLPGLVAAVLGELTDDPASPNP